MQTVYFPSTINREMMQPLNQVAQNIDQTILWQVDLPGQGVRLPPPVTSAYQVSGMSDCPLPTYTGSSEAPKAWSLTDQLSAYCNCDIQLALQNTSHKRSEIVDISQTNSVAYESEINYNKKTGRNRRSLICNYPGCGMKFTKSWNLLDHSRSHTGERPYACQLCNLRFTQKGNLNKHMKVHSNLSVKQRKVFKCQHCDKSYTEKFNLNVHMRKHKGVKVEIRKKAKRMTPAQPHQDSKKYQNKLLNYSLFNN